MKCPVADPALAEPACVARLVEELAIVQPKIVVVMGDDALDVAQRARAPARAAARRRSRATIQRLTPSIEALYVPDIDEALDEEAAKRAFWRAFRVLGDWYASAAALLRSARPIRAAVGARMDLEERTIEEPAASTARSAARR